MLPKNSKHFIQPVSEELGYDSELVQDVITFYYEELKKTLTDLEFHNIQVEELGLFKAKKDQLPKLYMKYKKQSEALEDPETFQKMTIKKSIEDKLEKVKALQKIIHEDTKRKAEFIKKKNEKNI